MGPIFLSPKVNGQALVATGVRAGAQGPRHWSGAHINRAVDVLDAKADAMAVIEAAGIPAQGLQVAREAPAWYHPGRSGVLKMGTNIVARFGEIHPATLEALDVKGPVVGFEVLLDNIPQPKKKGTARALLQLASLQPLSRDFAFLVDASVEADALSRAIKGCDKDLITGVQIFDIYSGKGVPEGKKSVALAVTLQPRQQSLTDEQIDAVGKKIIDAVVSKTGAVLRG